LTLAVWFDAVIIDIPVTLEASSAGKTVVSVCSVPLGVELVEAPISNYTVIEDTNSDIVDLSMPITLPILALLYLCSSIKSIICLCSLVVCLLIFTTFCREVKEVKIFEDD
jgi:hypothetical protein